MAPTGLCFNSFASLPHKIFKLQSSLRCFFSAAPSNLSSAHCRKAAISMRATSQYDVVGNLAAISSPNSFIEHDEPPLLGLEDVMTGYILGKRKATEVAHAVWKNVVRKGDVVVDATCGNGYDTLAMLRLIADEKRRGRVYGMDLQKDALESTSSLLDQSVNPDERELVELYAICHSKMEEIVPNGISVRLVAFNLGYLPGGDKRIKTEAETTFLALEAAKRIIARGGLISIVVYLGHYGGSISSREEFKTVESFASCLPVQDWCCCKLQMLNRPSAPVLVLLSKK